MRRVRPTQLAIGLTLLALAGAGLTLAIVQKSNGDALLIVLGTLVAMAATVAAPSVHPALPITIGLMLTVFSGYWDHLGFPFGVDRPIVAYGAYTAALRLLPDARHRWTLRLGRLHLLFIVVAIIGVASAVHAGTFGKAEPTFALSERLGIAGMVLFTVSTRAFASQRSRDWLLIGFLVLGAYLSLIGMLEGLGLDRLVFPSYINDPDVGLTPGRARGPMVESGSFGLALFVCLVAAVIAGVRWRKPWVRALCVAIGTACVLSIVFTLTRQAWLGAVLGAIAALLATPRLRRLAVPTAIGGAALVLLALVVVPGLAGKVSDRGRDRLPVYDRLNSDKAAAAMTLDRPIFGAGWYTFKRSSLPYLEQAETYPLRSVEIAHNVFLGFFSELGLVGGGLWLLAIGIAIGSAILGRAPNELEPWRIGLIAIAVDWFVIANLAPLGGAFTNYVLWIWPAVVWAGLPPRPVEARIRAARAARFAPYAPLRPSSRLAVMLLAVAVGGAVGYGVGSAATPTYRARADMTVGSLVAQSLDYPYAFVGYETLASTYSRLGHADQVIDPAARRLGMTPEALRSIVTVTPLLDAPVVSVRVKGPTAAVAAQRTRTVAEAMRASVARFNAQLPTRRALKRAFEAANRLETQTYGRIEDAYRSITAAGRPADDLTSVGRQSLAQAQATAAAADLRRVGIGSRYTSIAGRSTGLTDLSEPQVPFIDRGGRRVDAQRYCVLFMILGLAAGALLGLFPPRRGQRRRSGRMSAQVA